MISHSDKLKKIIAPFISYILSNNNKKVKVRVEYKSIFYKTYEMKYVMNSILIYNI